MVIVYWNVSIPGISEEDQQTLANEVSVVIHSAATVKFDEKLKLSINVNVQGTKRIVELCKRMTKLAVSAPYQLNHIIFVTRIPLIPKIHLCM